MAPKTALLIIDMQRYFESMTTTALPNIKRLITHFQHTSSPIIFTQHGHTPDELSGKTSNQLVRKWGPNGSIAINSHAWHIQDSLQHYLKDTPSPTTKPSSKRPRIVLKNTYDAFINTNLQQILDEANVQRVVVCGVMTDCCCDTTARSAFNRGFETWLVGDACGSANRKQHEAGLRGFGFAFGEILGTEEACGRLGEEE
ncbi:hypothetical protein LTR64_001507 [Lithohypha guttulata]|uniref:uncharacterized protein n=1 Tax=Lithohypha guttulata TaxID=1690604 RepID=UPI002DDDDEF4|nr:hypothetical protein LTR51_003701 [Lithohypha guttulata]